MAEVSYSTIILREIDYYAKISSNSWLAIYAMPNSLMVGYTTS